MSTTTAPRPDIRGLIVPLAGNAAVRMYRLDATGGSLDTGTVDTIDGEQVFTVIHPAQGCGPLAGYDPETDDLPTVEALATHISNPPPVLATAADIAAHRYSVEQGGVNVATSTGTHRFDTTRENRSMWLAIQLAALGNPALTQGWKTLDHGFVMLSNADILAVTDAVYAHVAQCFGKEAVLLANPPARNALPAAFAAA